MLRTIPTSLQGSGPAKRQRGLTLLELMVTVAIVAILGTLAAPSFRAMIQANQTRTVASELMDMLNLARSEAARRGQPVSICPSSDGSSCSSAGTGWDSGWIAFVNENHANTSVNEKKSPIRDQSEQLLQVRRNLPAGVSVRPNGNFTNGITFLRTGLVWGTATGTFAICAGTDADLKKRQPQAIVVIATRAVLATDSNDDGIPEKGEEGNLQSCENP